MVSIFHARVSLDESRPQIDFTLPRNKKNDWGLLDEVLRGEAPMDRHPPLQIFIDLKGEEAWDAYAVPGTLGLFSGKAVDAIPKGALEGFELLDARLNLQTYVFLKPVRRVPCIDMVRSQVTKIPGTDRLMSVEKWAFLPGCVADPRVFCPSEIKRLLVTHSVAEALQAAGCRGIDLRPLGTA